MVQRSGRRDPATGRDSKRPGRERVVVGRGGRGYDTFIFQPIVNYRTLEFDKALSARHICQIVNRWADFAGLNQNPDKDDPDRPGSRKKPKPRLKLSPHDLRRTAVTRALSLGFTIPLDGCSIHSRQAWMAQDFETVFELKGLSLRRTGTL
jgi:hypothetical protein